jgi:single-strand DNA-binding protein
MARSVNKVFLIGNLGQDPELRYTGGGTAVCNMRLATNESYKDSDGELVEKTEWHNIVAWSGLAEVCGEHLKKGDRVHFEGSLETRQWEDRDGNTRYTTQVKVRELLMLDGARASEQNGRSDQNGRSQQRPQQRRQRPPQRQTATAAGGHTGREDEAPF